MRWYYLLKFMPQQYLLVLLVTFPLPYLQALITAQFELQVRVDGYDDSVNDCGDPFDICALYINDICLGPQIEDNESCSLERDGNDLDLSDGDLPRTRTLTVVSQPWPVSGRILIPVYRVVMNVDS